MQSLIFHFPFVFLIFFSFLPLHFLYPAPVCQSAFICFSIYFASFFRTCFMLLLFHPQSSTLTKLSLSISTRKSIIFIYVPVCSSSSLALQFFYVIHLHFHLLFIFFISIFRLVPLSFRPRHRSLSSGYIEPF